MGKKNKYIEEEISEAATEQQIDPTEEETGTQPEAENPPAQDQPAAADFYWDCGDTRYNIGDKVFLHGARLTNIPVDEDGSPSDPALKAAYKQKFLKAKE